LLKKVQKCRQHKLCMQSEGGECSEDVYHSLWHRKG